MKKAFAISLFVFFCVKVQGQIVVNADGTHSIQHGPHIINPNGTISVQHGPHIINSDGSVSVKHGSVIVNTNGSHSTVLEPDKDDSKDNRNHSLELLSNQNAEKQQKSHQFYFQSRMMGTAARLDRFDAERKIRKEEKKLKKERLRDKKLELQY